MNRIFTKIPKKTWVKALNIEKEDPRLQTSSVCGFWLAALV
nr:hypothetical protein [Agrobacterium sp. rho-8.1]